MATSLKQTVINNISSVYNLAQNSKLEDSLFELLENELTFLANYFHISKPQALFVATIFTLNFKGKSISLSELNSFFDCSPLKLLEFSDELDQLFEKRILRKNKSLSIKAFNTKSVGEVFTVNEIVSDKIMNSEPIPKEIVNSTKYDDIFSLLEEINTLCCQRKADNISTRELFQQTKSILKENAHLKLIEETKKISANIEEKYLFLNLVWNLLDGNKMPWVENTYKDIYDQPIQRFLSIQRLLAKENNLIKEDLVQIEEALFYDDTRMELSEKALDLISDCDIHLINKKANKKQENLITPESIKQKQLIYSTQEMQQINLLKDLLRESNFQNAIERLSKKALPKGITAILHGVPGTGKTESVMQIAKATNRDIIKVDISETRSMWFGSSEKQIKQIFKNYRSYVKRQKRTPILLFNEADAILSKRKDNIIASTNDTENRMQNILLEEIENFEGILIATTNLTNNMDSAFERRFLFKIEFQKPSQSSKTKIWQLKMPHLSIEKCKLLASKFDFSGGQIDNIVRKNEINEIIHGRKVSIDRLFDYCREETLHQQTMKVIGFQKNNNYEGK